MKEFAILDNKKDIQEFLELGWECEYVQLNSQELHALLSGKYLGYFDGEKTTVVIKSES